MTLRRLGLLGLGGLLGLVLPLLPGAACGPRCPPTTPWRPPALTSYDVTWAADPSLVGGLLVVEEGEEDDYGRRITLTAGERTIAVYHWLDDR